MNPGIYLQRQKLDFLTLKKIGGQKRLGKFILFK
jgi:hypothetical protein